MPKLIKWFSASPVAGKVIAAPQEPMPRRVGDDFEFPDVKIKKGLADPHDFAAWLVDEGVQTVESCPDLHELWTSYSMIHGYQYASKLKVTYLVSRCCFIEKWRDRSANNATKYRVHQSIKQSKAA